MSASLLQRILAKEGLAFLDRLASDELEALAYNWEIRGRPEQHAPLGDWTWWVITSGRGWGKSLTGSQWVRRKAREKPGSIGAIVGATPEDARRIQIEHPQTGVLHCSPPEERPTFKASVSGGELIWPNGSMAHVFSGALPAGTRGSQYDWVWMDELPHWKFPQQVFDNIALGLRLGKNPQGMVTATPLPTALMRRLTRDPNNRVTRGSTYDNRDNLAPTFIREIETKYEGTRLGRQELHGELLEDVPGALWRPAQFDADGFRGEPSASHRLVCVAVDPAVTANEDSDETGIIVAGMTGNEPARFEVLADVSGRMSPNEWARAAMDTADLWQANAIVGEVNNGGDMVRTIVESFRGSGSARFEEVRAARSKYVRAEPSAALYEQNRVRHCGRFDALEDQLTTFVPGSKKSPDRLDALVWALTWLSDAKPFVMI